MHENVNPTNITIGTFLNDILIFGKTGTTGTEVVFCGTDIIIN